MQQTSNEGVQGYTRPGGKGDLLGIFQRIEISAYN